VTREAIIQEARRIVARDGVAALTFQALAGALGVSKQAIIYWFPSKWELAREYALRGLQAEADEVIAAVTPARTAAEAVELGVRALTRHHLRDLANFRTLYMSAHVDISTRPPAGDADALAPVHQTTSRMYAVLEERIAADPAYRPGENPRRLAVAAHMAAVGLLTLVALADAMQDPLRHGTEALVDALVVLLIGSSAANQIEA
jgi:AcrR family transcriptional regulator